MTVPCVACGEQNLALWDHLGCSICFHGCFSKKRQLVGRGEGVLWPSKLSLYLQHCHPIMALVSVLAAQLLTYPTSNAPGKAVEGGPVVWALLPMWEIWETLLIQVSGS